MKRKIISAAVLASVLLSGCSEKSGTSGGTISSSETGSVDSSQSTQSVQTTQSSQSSKSGAPTVIAPNFQGSSWQNAGQNSSSTIPETPDEPSVSETPGETSSNTVPNTPTVPSDMFNKVSVNKGETMMIADQLHVESGTLYSVEGDMIVDDGASLVVDDGGYLSISGKLVISDAGEFVISEGGCLAMTNDNAVIEGGCIRMETDFGRLSCEHGTITSQIIPPERKVVDGVTTVGGVVIANKAIKLPPEYGSHLSLNEVEPQVYEALVEMNNDAVHEYINKSGYRSYYDQVAIFQNYCDMYGYEEADTFSSHAGHSEHQTGLPMDLDSFSESYGATPEGIWLAENCWRYGFIIRYPKGKEDITGYTYEPWHVRWLGKSTAKLVFDSGLTLEEFLNVEGGWTVID